LRKGVADAILFNFTKVLVARIAPDSPQRIAPDLNIVAVNSDDATENPPVVCVQSFNALGMLSDGEDPEEAYFEGDTLTSSLFDWAKGNSSLVNDYIRECGWGGNIEAAICGAQAEEERNIAIRVRDYLNGILDDFDDEDEWKDDDAIAEFVAVL